MKIGHLLFFFEGLLIFDPRLPHTLMCLIEGQALINWQGGIFSKFNKRAGSNKEAGWNIFSNLIRGQERFVPYKRAGWKFNK